MPQRPTRPPRRWLLLPLALAACLALPGRAAAQECTEEPCGPIDFTDPTVTISPTSGSRPAGALAVQVNFSDNYMLDHWSRQIVFNGVDVTSAFSYTQTNNWTTRANGSVSIGTGANTLSATICDWTDYNCTTTTVTYTGPAPAARVTPDGGSLQAALGTKQSARFTVVNTGTTQSTYALAPSCSGVTGCAAPASVTVAAADSVFVEVSFTAAGSGTVQLTASASGVSDAGSVSVGVLAAVDPGYPLDGPSMERIERAECVTIGMGASVAYECGDLRLAHPLPAARSVNKERTPTLVYNHNHAWPFILAAAHVTPRAGTRPDTVRGYMTVGTTNATARKWPGWPSDTTKRVAVGLYYNTMPTGIYTYRLTIVAEFNGSATRDTLHTRTGKLVHVNRNGSAFGPGWWLAGVEQVYPQAGDSLVLWVGGDGSARIYRGTPGANQWTAEAFDRPDVLRRVNGEYVRSVPGGAEVWFSSAGHHVRTVNSLGHVTHFRYNANGTLGEMVLPTAGGQADSLRYTFQYGGTVAGCATSTTTGLTRVGSPAPGGGYRYTDLCVDGATRRPSRITDPDGKSVSFTWTSVSALATRTDRRGGIAFFGYSSGQFTQIKQVAAVGDSLFTGLGTGAATGYSTATAVENFNLVLNPPRTDVNDRSYWWLGRYGMPYKIQNAAGGVTLIERGDPRWPAKVTRLVQPSGFETTATYDTRGNLAGTTAWNPYGDGRNATTTYQWHPTWDAVTQIVSPEGEVSLFDYDAQGRRAWEQSGTNAARRISYTYYPLGSSAPGLVSSVSQGGLTETYEYDDRGNLGAINSPTGIRTESFMDRLGRPSVNRTPVGDGTFRTETMYYNIVDQLDSTVTAAGTQRLIVRNTFDNEGNLTSVSRRSDPDPAGIGTVTTQWVYDLAGRRTVEIAPDGMRDSTVLDKSGNAMEVHGRRRDASGSRYVVRMKYDGMNRLTQRIVPEVVYQPEDVGIAQRGFIFPHEPILMNGYYGLDPSRRRSPPYPFYPTDTLTWRYVIRADTSTFTYHVTGGMTAAHNRDARVRRSYYPNGQMRGDTSIARTMAEISAGGNWTSHVYGTEHTYDRAGRRVELKHPDVIAPRVGGVLKDRTRWAYDPQGRLAEVTDPLGNAFRYTYDMRGQVESLAYPGGISDSYRYDNEGRLVRHQTLNNSTSIHRYPGSMLRNDTLTYDVRGKLLTSHNRLAAGDTTIASYTPFGHLQQVTTTSRGDPIWGVTPYSRITEASAHDAMGNRTGVSIASTFELGKSYQTNVTNQTWAYQAGTGRQFRAGSSVQRDTTMFDEAGNVHFTTTVDYAYNSSAPDLRDEMYYYGADNLLRAAETRVVDTPSGFPYEMSNYSRSFEVYRYDALGRRVLVWLRRDCREPGNGTAGTARSVLCETGYVRRTVWDGDHELYEIQAWAGWDGNYLVPAEVDTGYVNLPKASPRSASDNGEYDINPFYGRVAYTHGSLLDQPLSVVRMGYGDMQDSAGYWVSGPARRVEPFAIVPLWNHRGQPALGTYGDGGWRLCAGNRCVYNTWPELWAGYARAQIRRSSWHGTLLEDRADGSGLNYRRNRYYDPNTGRFTQEDPIGLAGGLNVYGFGEGDPVSYSDPYGLCAFGIGIDAAMGRCGDALGAGLDPADRDIIINQLAETTRQSASQVRAQLLSRDGLRLAPGTRLELAPGTVLVARAGNVLRLRSDGTAAGEGFNFSVPGYSGVITRLTMNFHSAGVPTELTMEGTVRFRGMNPRFSGRMVFGAGVTANPTECRFRAGVGLIRINRCN